MPAVQFFYPEMGETRPASQLEVRQRGNRYLLKTPMELPAMRGLTFKGVLTSEMLVPQAQHKVGWREYEATEAAFKKLMETHTASQELLLD